MAEPETQEEINNHPLSSIDVVARGILKEVGAKMYLNPDDKEAAALQQFLQQEVVNKIDTTIGKELDLIHQNPETNRTGMQITTKDERDRYQKEWDELIEYAETNKNPDLEKIRKSLDNLFTTWENAKKVEVIPIP
jgi:hypothetical protein